MTASAQGVDISAYQQPVTTARLHGLSFAYCKATEGTGITDPHFAANWRAIEAAGIHRGAYHELTPGDGAAQALHFTAALMRQGLRPGDMLACVASDYATSGAQVKAFCDQAARIAGPKCPVLVYSDLSRLPSLASCTAYPLWIAAYRGTAPASVAPWHRWTFWQPAGGGGADGGDPDAFNGTAAELDAWIAAYTGTAPKPPVPAPHPATPTLEEIVALAPTVQSGSTGQAVKNWQGLLCAHGHTVAIDGSFGTKTHDATVAFQKSKGLTQDGVAGPLTLKAALT